MEMLGIQQTDGIPGLDFLRYFRHPGRDTLSLVEIRRLFRFPQAVVDFGRNLFQWDIIALKKAVGPASGIASQLLFEGDGGNKVERCGSLKAFEGGLGFITACDQQIDPLHFTTQFPVVAFDPFGKFFGISRNGFRNARDTAERMSDPAAVERIDEAEGKGQREPARPRCLRHATAHPPRSLSHAGGGCDASCMGHQVSDCWEVGQSLLKMIFGAGDRRLVFA